MTFAFSVGYFRCVFTLQNVSLTTSRLASLSVAEILLSRPSTLYRHTMAGAASYPTTGPASACRLTSPPVQLSAISGSTRFWDPNFGPLYSGTRSSPCERLLHPTDAERSSLRAALDGLLTNGTCNSPLSVVSLADRHHFFDRRLYPAGRYRCP
jgi:hypothetical protein